ncbi:MAG: hypothetical protein J6R46_04595, partial [Clostridia bacterium]|nr:hypothetical protein [Clostridia bacterium]
MRYNEQTGGVEIELRELCALAFGRGNYKEESDAEQDVTVLDAKDGSYYRDVCLQHTCRYAGVLIKVMGTAQGIEIGQMTMTLDYTVRAARIPEPDEIFTVPVRQRCLAYMLAFAKGLDAVNVRRLTVTSKGECASTVVPFGVQALSDEYASILSRALPYIESCVEQCCKVKPRAAELAFPYPEVRAGQEEFMRECFRDIMHQKRLFIQAPTGIGKTISTLYPAVRAMGKGKCDKVFYLTAKASTR